MTDYMPPSPDYSSPLPPPPGSPPPLYPYSYPTKSRSTALLLEILPGLFGLYGIGWIYANKTGAGIGILIGGIVWNFVALAIDIATGGFGFLCSVPINIAMVVTSSILINNYTKAHPELFR